MMMGDERVCIDRTSDMSGVCICICMCTHTCIDAHDIRLRPMFDEKNEMLNFLPFSCLYW